MRVFLSYASKDNAIAGRINTLLARNNHEVFFDKKSLHPGEDFNKRIQEEVDKSDLFIFLFSYHSIAKHCYCHTELNHAKDKWEDPTNRVIPIRIDEVPIDQLPDYLSSSSILNPKGDLPAEVLRFVSQAEPSKPRHDQEWKKYSIDKLQPLLDKPLFDTSVSLRQVYIPLRAYFIRNETQGSPIPRVEGQPGSSKSDRVSIELEQALEEWLSNASESDPIRLLSGGPGSGKSSFAKMFAVKQAEKGNLSVLFIPLHLFNIFDDLIDAVGQFVAANEILTFNPLERKHRPRRLLIIFDGLDELSMQGKTAEQSSREFIEEIQRKVNIIDQKDCCLQVLLTGRELFVQARNTDLRGSGRILYLLPYLVQEEERKLYVEGEEILKHDQRQEWWNLYKKAIGDDTLAWPTSLDNGNWREFTAQPLLIHLLALSLKGGMAKLPEEVNRNKVYESLIDSIYMRPWADSRHAGIKDLEREEFFEILEIIARSIWYGNGRTASVQEIEKACTKNPRITALLERLQREYEYNSRAKIIGMMTAFYFRKLDGDPSEKTFEFTHKSFGEYLLARLVVKELDYIHQQYKDRHHATRDPWDEPKCLAEWAEFFGTSRMDEYLFAFVLDEIRLRHMNDPAQVEDWQQTLCYFIDDMLKRGMPVHELECSKQLSFQQQVYQARNAEEALFAVLNCCARTVQKLSKFNEPSVGSLGGLISRHNKESGWDKHNLLRECLSFIDLSTCQLTGIDLINANLQYCSLEHANLSFSLLMGARLQHARIHNTDLCGANISNANFEDAQLENIILKQAITEGANLDRATKGPGVYLDEAIDNYLTLTTDGNHGLVEEDFTGKVQQKMRDCTEILQVCQYAVSHARLLNCQAAFIYLLDKDGYITRIAIDGNFGAHKGHAKIPDDWLYDQTWRDGQGKPEHYTPDNGNNGSLTGRGFPETGEERALGKTQHAANFEREFSNLGEYKYGVQYKQSLGNLLSGISVKIAGSSRPYGAIDLISKKDSKNELTRFTKEDYYLLDSIARITAAQISRIRKKSREHIMDILINGLYTVRASEHKALKQACQNLANELISHAFPFKVCIIRQYSKANGFTTLAKSPLTSSKEYGISWNPRSKGQPGPDPDHVTQYVINQKKVRFCKDLKGDLDGKKAKFHNGEWIDKNYLASLAIYPLISNKEVVGTISIYTGYIYQFSDEDQDFLANVSRLLAFLVDQCPRK